jgi:hypothetical protein
MTRRPPRYLFMGIVAGAVSSVFVVILSYLAGVFVIAHSMPDRSQEALIAVLLAAVTVLPLLLLIVVLPTTLLVGITAGFLLGLGSRLRGRPLGTFAGALVGLALSELVFSVALPHVAPPRPSGDFVSIVSSPYLSAAYGLTLGSTAGLIFRRLIRAE